MCSAFKLAVITGVALLLISTASAQVLRVCADPNDLPYSNDRQQGFENKITELIATDLGRQVQYVWLPASPRQSEKLQRTGGCDIMTEVPSHYPLLQPTEPYYSSSYVFVTRRDRHMNLHSLDDPFLRVARIGLHGLGDGSFIPPAQELASRGIVRNIAVYSIFGNLSKENPPAELIRAVARGDVDVAIAWGPLAGFFSQNSPVPLDVTPICPPTHSSIPLAFDLSVGVRHGDDALVQQINSELTRRKGEIRQILTSYGVPMIDPAVQARSCQ